MTDVDPQPTPTPKPPTLLLLAMAAIIPLAGFVVGVGRFARSEIGPGIALCGAAAIGTFCWSVLLAYLAIQPV